MHIFFADKGDEVYHRMKSQGTKIPAETLLCLYTKSKISKNNHQLFENWNHETMLENYTNKC